jgi:hypothetical protein
MTRFLDVRASTTGGNLASEVGINQGTNINNYQSVDLAQLATDIRGKHVLVGIHGYNVSRADGILHLSNWEGLLKLPDPSIFIGLLWPGDSVWAHGLDYPDEPKIANEAGEMIGPFLDANFTTAASISLASHSLGARVLLETISNMKLKVRRVVIMAGAIDDDCLNTEFKDAVTNVGQISALASKEDDVLEFLFPLGNLLGGILAEGHPWWHSALGRFGPASPQPANFTAPFLIPDNWDYGHGNYLQVDPPPAPAIPMPTIVPANGTPRPAGGATGWQETYSAAFCSTRFE